MRCLYCNKKLSLLKLAKGDSFCSPQHFDAYQLQLSKDAFDRLVSVAAEETHKPPLAVDRPVERLVERQEASPSEESTALARLSAFAPPPLPESAVPAPPYAPFATSPLPAFELNPPFPIANGPDASQAVEPPREVSFPVHQTEDASCILNLHLQLSLAETEPKNWTPEPHLIVAPEHFRLEISQPPFGATPEFPEIENLAPVEPVAEAGPDRPVEALPLAETPVEVSQPATAIDNLAPVQPVLFIEAAAPADPVEAEAPVEITQPAIAIDNPAPADPVEAFTEVPVEISQPPTAIENLAPIQPVLLIEAAAPEVAPADLSVEALPFADVPVEISQPPAAISPEVAEIHSLATVEPISPIEAAAPPVADHPTAHSVEALPFADPSPSIKPVMHAEPVDSTPIEPPRPRVPFLIAPSFNPRTGSPILIHNAATSAPTGSNLNPIREKGTVPRPDPCRDIPDSTRFAETNLFHLQDSTAHLASGPELRVEPAFVRPNAKNQPCGDAWSPSDRRIVVALPALEASRAAMPSVDCEIPAPKSLMVRSNTPSLSKIDPQQLLAGTPLDLVSLLHGILETSPQGREPVFADLPASANESVWRAILASFPASEPLPTAWQHQTAYRSTSGPIAAGGESRISLQESFPHSPACIKIGHIDQAWLPAPYIANNLYQSARWPEADSALVPVASESCLVLIGSTTRPHAANLPAGSLKRGPGDPSVPWKACPAASTAPRAVKFLPIREGAILPSAKSWKRLDAVPC